MHRRVSSKPPSISHVQTSTPSNLLRPNSRQFTCRRSYFFVGVLTAATGVILTRSGSRPFVATSGRIQTSLFSPRRLLQQLYPFSRGLFGLPVDRPTSQSPSSQLKKQQGKSFLTPFSMYGGGSGVSVPARGTASACVIFLHGLGDTGAGWASAFPMPNLEHVQTLLPTADVQSVSLNGGMPMPSWFDLYGLDEHSEEDEKGIESAVARVERIIDGVVAKGIPSHRIIVAGFSQGGAVALTTALRSQRKLAGVVALSTWLPLRQSYPQMLGPQINSIPFFVGHGTADQIVHISLAELSVKALQKLGVDTSLSRYQGVTHSASESELRDVANFIATVTPPM